jgi:two-component system, cell cycle response regulator
MNSGYPVLIVEDHPALRRQLELTLAKAGFSVAAAENGREALGLFKDHFFPIVLTDWMMPEMDGIQLCAAIRALPAAGYVYVVLLTAKSAKEDIVAGLRAGADDFLTKPFHPAELIARLNTAKRILELEHSLKRANDEITALSIRDPLTGIYNRNYLNDHLPKEIKRAQKYMRSFSIVLCDIDRFKSINDTYGHLAGDQALVTFVECISSSIRADVDWIARFGGDEFIVVLPETTVEGGGAAAERFARIIREKFVEIGGEKIHLSATFGVTGFDRASVDESIEVGTLIGIADRCLYEAKEREKGTVNVEPWRPALTPAVV